MKSVEEYAAYIIFRNKSNLEGIVTLEESENDYQDYLKRILLRRLFLLDDLHDKEIELLLKRFGVFSKACSLEEMSVAWNLTKERIRQIESKALRKLVNPEIVGPFLRTITTQENFVNAILLASNDNASISEQLQSYVKYFD